MPGVTELVPAPSELLGSAGRTPLQVLRGVEEALDSVVCAYVACRLIEGACRAYGDESAAIWLPEVKAA